MTEAKTTPQIFICYAHNDNNSSEESKRWLDRLQEHLAPLELQGKVEIWSDREIELGENWHERIQETLQQVKAAVLLVSPAFLASKYIRNSELPVLLKNAKDKGVAILPILLRQCSWRETTFKYPDSKAGPEELSLSEIQIPTTKPLNGLAEHEQDEVLYQVTQRIHQIVKEKSKVEKESDDSSNEVQQQESGKQPSSSEEIERQSMGENLQEISMGNYAPNPQGSNVISGQSVQGNTFIGTQHNYGTGKGEGILKRTSSSTGVARHQLLDTLKRLIPAQFNELIFLLEAPNEYLPHQNTSQSEKATALLTWASAPGGIGLMKVKEVLDDFLQNP